MYKWASSIALLFALVVHAEGGGSRQADFIEEFDSLGSQHSSGVAKEEMVRRYQEFAKRYVGHPDVGKAYLEIASYYSYEDPEWAENLNEAVARAKVGSDLWVQAKLQLFNDYNLMDPGRAKEILVEMEPRVRGDLLNMARVNLAFQTYHLHRKDYAEAEKECRKILSLEISGRRSKGGPVKRNKDCLRRQLHRRCNTAYPVEKVRAHRNPHQIGGGLRALYTRGRSGDRGYQPPP